MLFRAPVLEKIARNEITLAFRVWKRPTVKEGGRLRTPVGELSITSVVRIDREAVSVRDARAAGYKTRSDLFADLAMRKGGKLYRIDFRFVRPDPRETLREQDDLEEAEVDALIEKLRRFDETAPDGAWTHQVLRAVAERAGITAREISDQRKVDKPRLKRRMLKLKELGLTESLASGYRISPRGAAYLDGVEIRRREGREA